jgi:hypothetical protein
MLLPGVLAAPLMLLYDGITLSGGGCDTATPDAALLELVDCARAGGGGGGRSGTATSLLTEVRWDSAADTLDPDEAAAGDDADAATVVPVAAGRGGGGGGGCDSRRAMA